MRLPFPIFCIALLLATLPARSQSYGLTAEDLERIDQLEDTIALLSYAVINDSLPEHRFGATKKLIPTLVEALKIPNSFHYPFPRVQSISIQYPADSSFRIFTWQLYVDVDEYRYYGAIQLNSPELQLFPLIDRSASIADVETDLLKPENWYGALYYKIHQFEGPQGRQYLLFGFDGYSFFNRRKLVEVLHFEEGQPFFGSDVFIEDDPERGTIVHQRLVKEYSAEASIKLNYDPLLDAIIFDHLILLGGSEEQGPTYVPDGSYEGYRLDGGYWRHVPKMFDTVVDEAPRPEPILDDKSKDIFGRKKGGQ